MPIKFQVEHDTQLRFWSNSKEPYGVRVRGFAEDVLRAFPDHELIFRSHPRDNGPERYLRQHSDAFRSHPRARFEAEGTTYQWIKHSKAVLGINSTVLLEALSFLTKPILAFGTGLFSDNGVMLEVGGDESRLREILSWSPSEARCRWFMTLLMHHHVPYKIDLKDVKAYPQLSALITQCKEGIVA